MIFVFGSNLAGRHGAGAALYAKENYGAVYGVGEGRTGQSYALPTKDKNLKSLSLAQINYYYSRFIEYVNKHPQEHFVLTPIGCGLAGNDPKRIMDMIKYHGLPNNVSLSNYWLEYLHV